MPALTQACSRALSHNLAFKSHERLLIITDNSKQKLCDAFKKAALGISAKVEMVTIPESRVNGAEPPGGAAERMLQADVILLLTSASLSWTRARMAATKNGARIASMGGGFNEEIALRAFAVDYAPIRERANQLCDLLDAANEINLTSRLGTNLQLNVEGRKAHGRKGGIYQQPGHWGNLPCGEAFIAPLENRTNGIYIVDASHAGVGKLREPIKITVRHGLAIAFDGGEQARTLQQMLASVRDKLAFNIAEFGIGCNHKAQITGATIEDEKALGTCHIALGNNAFFGGVVEVGIHLDGIFKAPSIALDGRLIMKNGNLLI